MLYNVSSQTILCCAIGNGQKGRLMNEIANRAETIQNNDSTFVCVRTHDNSDMQRLIDLWQHLKAMLTLENKYVVINEHELCIRVDGSMGFSLNEFKSVVASSNIGNVEVNMFDLYYKNGAWIRNYYNDATGNAKTVCSICGKEYNCFDEVEDFSIHKERCGYGTMFDGDKLDLNICCSCMNDLIDKCKVSPVIVNNL